MVRRKFLINGLIGTTGAIFAVTQLNRGGESQDNVVSAAVVTSVENILNPETVADREGSLKAQVASALDALSGSVRKVSHPRALEDAFSGYFAYKAANPSKVRKPYLYFVDYGLPNTTARGYVFDMDALEVVEGPFTVSHGRGSTPDPAGIPTRFSNRPGSAATSLGLYLAQETYSFSGKMGGKPYRSIGLRMAGLSKDYNSNARVRGVVAHGAPYVTSARAGRSEGCPAMEEARARRLLPKLADGGLVFLFAPEESWRGSDPWLLAAAEAGDTHTP